ncbi:MAG: hypothetical protein ACO1SV_20380 [Fimbriimonas sp.]
MKHLLLSLGLFAALAVVAPAQSSVTTPKAAKSDATMQKIRQVDVLIQLLPLNLKKAQIDTILMQQEKAKEAERKIRLMEDDDLEKIDGKLSEALKAGLEKGAYPPRELQVEVAKLTRAMAIRRQVALGEMVEAFWEGIKGAIEPGQRTIMIKSLDVAALDPSLKADKMDDDAKLRFYIRRIFLDATAYESLKELRKTAS